ncbi:hypothetical protein HO173_007701 [Letharia columbiana]|uniref:Tryptophan synthase beta chain-like PALP domain-containing protein n=1 Tax=Letharia columbiana TaxID=112416 RepID=A0A8H6FTA5_9LECA|nr:uncharacterized protein HO173_007701 [Letharia columbiana]KAF6234279.1 hypothetical protein HO173_007701 [Letharia columbiana]
MADLSRTLPLKRSSVQSAHERIKDHIQLTPVLTSTTLSNLASTPQTPEALVGTPFEGQRPARPRINFFFKCENYQRTGSFKIRGAFHALSRLSEEELAKGVVTHSSGNHAQALALAARTHGIPAHIVMPTISTPSKIAATQGYGANVYFSGSTSDEREAVVKDVIRDTGAVLVPPYDHPDIILGQGTMALELEEQAREWVRKDPALSVHHKGQQDVTNGHRNTSHTNGIHASSLVSEPGHLDAVIAPIGGGGMLSGIATALHGTGTYVFGAEPSFEGADDARRGLAAKKRVTTVRTLTIADGLRTPVGEIPWTIISDKTKMRGIHAVTEEQILQAMRLVLERMKLFVEPSAVVGLAVALYDEEFRSLVEKEGGEEGWDVGVVLSGGNTTVEAISKMFAVSEGKGERMEGKLGGQGERIAENVAG